MAHTMMSSRKQRALLLMCAFALYIILFRMLYATLGHGMGAAVIIPTVAAGWMYGMRGGIIAGIATLPLTCLLCMFMDVPDWVTKVLVQAAPAYIATILIGGIVGRVVELNVRVREELAARRQTEVALKSAQEHFRSIAESSPDAVISTDHNNNIIFWNQGAERIFGYLSDEVMGQPAFMLIPEEMRKADRERFTRFVSRKVGDFTGKTFEAIALRKNREVFQTEQSLSTWQVAGERFFTNIVRDISDRKHIEQEREGLIGQLQKALADVKTLSGMLPICASCKKVRDDKGYWDQIESYISRHSDAVFSHGLCPSCARTLYPTIFPRVGEAEQPPPHLECQDTPAK
jgi:PAS domain S-box-containing protein